ncbi:phosphoesterase [Sulfurimonas sp.]|uniref:DHH family phosphoesterase n=1 Tax=Sulfurimonas sp. TaxID=2022749 RepID=UPI002AB17EF7|nr:phosphoesterase [Sulfurimonas sp.]
MNDILKKIVEAKHIVILSNIDNIAGASALYTHIIRLHKKVSLVCREKNCNKEFNLKYSFLPWFDKIKDFKPASADCVIEFDNSCVSLYEYFQKSNMKINSKMATALYSGLLQESESFTNKIVNGTIFAMAKELIECGAQIEICSKYMLKTSTLSSLRLKSKMLGEFLLEDEAKVAVFSLSSEDLKASGARVQDCDEVLKESLKLPTVEMAVLLDIDNKYEMIKIISKEI